MSLFDYAALELQEIMNDDLGASVECAVVSPSGISADFLCRMSDIAQSTDVNTRETISGRRIAISISLLDLVESNFEGIRGVEKKTSKPWKVTFENILGVSGTYKVVESSPDNTLGIIVLHLEAIK